MQILYNACKHFSCKILHATHAKQGATKTEQSRRKLRNKTTVFIKQLLFIQVTERQQKINFYGGATTKKNKGQGFYIFYITKLSSCYNTVGTGPSLGFCLDMV
jgi:hypothetical protein